MSEWYDKQGNKIPELLEWAKLFEDREYKIVQQDTTADGKYFVSTVWLGLNHEWDENKPPLIFETMVFGAKKKGDRLGRDVDQVRYSTLEQAIKGHAEMMNKWRGKDSDAKKIS